MNHIPTPTPYATPETAQLRVADSLLALLGDATTEPRPDIQLEALTLTVAADLPVLLWGEPGIGKTVRPPRGRRDLPCRGWQARPVLSSGVHLATYGALLAARSVNSGLAGDDGPAEERLFGEFEARYRHEYGRFYEFLVSFYDKHPDERSYFWKARKVTNVGATELEAFVELVGGLASGDASLPGTGEAGARLTTAAAELDGAVGRLPGSDGLRNPLFEAPTVRQVFQEGAVLQERGVLGGPLEEETPVRPGGLVASEDGLTWVDPAR